MKMRWGCRLWVGILLFIFSRWLGVSAEPGQSASHVGYVYPAGARQGANIEITAGGQGLRKVQEIYISGEGVRATAIHTIPEL